MTTTKESVHLYHEIKILGHMHYKTELIFTYCFDFSKTGFLCVALAVLDQAWPQTHRDPPASVS